MRYGFGEYAPSKIIEGHIATGGSDPARGEIGANSLFFTRGVEPWLPVMGEYHFTRDRRENWYKELCKMKAGGIDVVSTYVFWIYHEEEEGVFDFTGDRNLRGFVRAAGDAGLYVMLRPGPWAHGECRNGGFPDWLLKKGFRLRSCDAGYMEYVKRWFKAVFGEVRGMLYRDGGGVIGVQLENELTNDAAHLSALKKVAVSAGFDVPLYTVTGWNSVYGARIPVDEVIPVFGAYPEAPWSRPRAELPPSRNYVFSKNRNDSAIGVDIMKDTDKSGWRLPYERYPFATCELGGGIQVTHHRRPRISPRDVYALSLVKLGCGNNFVGYYMYHGGVNKIGRTTLQESTATGYPNDYAILDYDFQAPISSYGETRRSYGLLNMLHMFVHSFGGMLAKMETVLSETDVAPGDTESLRYAMRTDGKSGFVFVNRYVRLKKCPEIKGAEIDTGSVVFPPIDVRDGASFILPFNMEMTCGTLEYATAQPLCRVGDAYFFLRIEGIGPEYKFSGCEPVRPDRDGYIYRGGNVIVTLTEDEAVRMRMLSGGVCIGCGCDIYERGGEIACDDAGGFAYKKWNGRAFETVRVMREGSPAEVSFEDAAEPFSPAYPEELSYGGRRARRWYRVSVTSDEGIVSIPFECDVSQLYVDGKLAADNFYYGEPWRIPAKMIFGHECCIVLSEMKDDFYREF